MIDILCFGWWCFVVVVLWFFFGCGVWFLVLGGVGYDFDGVVIFWVKSESYSFLWWLVVIFDMSMNYYCGVGVIGGLGELVFMVLVVIIGMVIVVEEKFLWMVVIVRKVENDFVWGVFDCLCGDDFFWRCG